MCIRDSGYIEDTGIPLLYRDNQVFAIWEGTTNVLSLDLLRALKKDQSWPMLMNFLKTELDKSTRAEKNKVQESFKKLNLWVAELYQAGDVALETEARELAFKLADLTGCVAWLRDLEGRSGSVTVEETKALSLFIEKRLAF